MSTWRTGISQVLPGKVLLRGYSLDAVMERLTFTEGIFLTLLGRLPEQREVQVLDTVLNSLLDHGFIAASVIAARYVVSGNPQFVPGVAAGLLTAGANTINPAHSAEFILQARARLPEFGGSVEKTAAAVVAEWRQSGRRFPGFGHPTHRDEDFRATRIFRAAETAGFAGEHTRLYRAIHAEFERVRGKGGIPINVDGAMAATLLEMGFAPTQITAVALLSVLPGIMGHVIEEMTDGVPLRVIQDAEYAGAPERPLERRKAAPIREG